MTQPRMNNLTKDQVVTCGYRSHTWTSVFLDFSNTDIKHSSIAKFDRWKDLKEVEGFKSFGDMDKALEGLEHGYSHYAIFKDVEDDMVWAAYRFSGRWCVGSSADPLRLIA